MIDIKEKKDCCGCNACADSCPHKAISFSIDNEGFWYPTVDAKSCTNCRKCERVCPMQNIESLFWHGQQEPKLYGAIHKNISIRFDSTSGGAFSAFANDFYKEQGYVSGAIFNDDWSVSNFISNNKKDLARLRSSKYVQSRADGLYSEIRRLLETGNKILACGSPCQMAALRTFLQKEYDNLLIVDFLCRATNSPKAYRKYLDMLEEIYGGKIVYIKAKNKDLGWRSLARKVVFDNGAVYYGQGHEDHYRRGYHNNFFERPSCYECKFKGIPRIADISLGDFWGIEKLDSSLDGNLGTSMIMVNTPKGMAFFEKVKSKMIVKEFQIENVVPYNKDALFKGGISYPKVDRAQMFADMDTMRFDEVANKYFPLVKKGMKQIIKEFINQLKIEVKHPSIILRSLFINNFSKVCTGNVFEDRYIRVYGHSAIDIHPDAQILCEKGIVHWGIKKNKKTKSETALYLEAGAELTFAGNNYFLPGADIQVFKGAKLRFGYGGTNMGLKIVCSDSIWIGDNTYIGRDVWIRDNNGGHTVVQTGYKDKAPIHIGDHVWICSNVQIMKGVTIGDGAIVSSNSVVTSNVPAHCMVSGNPAKVIAEDIVWVH